MRLYKAMDKFDFTRDTKNVITSKQNEIPKLPHEALFFIFNSFNGDRISNEVTT